MLGAGGVCLGFPSLVAALVRGADVRALGIREAQAATVIPVFVATLGTWMGRTVAVALGGFTGMVLFTTSRR